MQGPAAGRQLLTVRTIEALRKVQQHRVQYLLWRRIRQKFVSIRIEVSLERARRPWKIVAPRSVHIRVQCHLKKDRAVRYSKPFKPSGDLLDREALRHRHANDVVRRVPWPEAKLPDYLRGRHVGR